MKVLNFAVLLLSILMSVEALPCSFAQLGRPQDLAGGQNFDFPPEVMAGIVVNKRNVEKFDAGFEGAPAALPMRWVSRYGSVTFGFGSNVPVTGINEAGLRIYRFLFLEAQYPVPSDRPALNESLFLQYLLDTAKSVSEVIEKTKSVQIYTPRFPTHFAVCDRSASCVVIEAMKGELRVFSGDLATVNAVTNTDYQSSLDVYRKCPTADCPYITDNSQWRFVKLASQIKMFTGDDFTGGVFNLLKSVEQMSPHVKTLWTLVAQSRETGDEFYVADAKSSRRRITIDLNSVDFSCKTPAKVALLRPADESPVKLVDFNKSFQLKMASVLNEFLGVSAIDMQKWAEYPDKKTHCLE